MKRYWPIVVLCLVGIVVLAAMFVFLESAIEARLALTHHHPRWSRWSKYGPDCYVAIAAGVLGWVMTAVLERQWGRIGWFILIQSAPLAALSVLASFALAVFGPASASRAMLQMMVACAAVAVFMASLRSLIGNYR